MRVVALLLTIAAAVPQGQEPRTPNAAQRTPNVERRTPNGLLIRVGIAKPGGGYSSVVEMPIEQYVARVVAGEAARDSQPAALEALAITVRTFAAANRGRHRADGFDLCDQTHCQVLRAATAATERAAEATSGRVLLHAGAPAIVYYSASCGGRTVIPSDVWPGHENPSYLPAQDDDACEGAPEWTAELDAADILRALHASGFRGATLRDIRIASRNRSRRVAELRLTGVDPDHVSGQDFRAAVGRTLGWQHIKSTAFELQRRGSTYRFAGRGSGHGVGLCVIGSARLAERGTRSEAILARYFPGLTIGQVGASGVAARAVSEPASNPLKPSAPVGPDREPDRGTAARPVPAPAATIRDPDAVVVSLPDEDEGERAKIERLTKQARAELARTLSVEPLPRVTLRFHATTDEYERATGRAWFTSATLVRGELHLLPLATLRDRGVLDRTIRHELVHLVTDPVLGSRPQWVREGAAIYFAGSQPLPPGAVERPAYKPPTSGSCPTDAELVRPVSVGALTSAYARARTCFAKQIQSGRSWRDVR